ncbi:endoplasmic reticulum protein [Flagelloscypha sp. PMI_526]|nr:endoplasmic reticulum protein [Flagelloscypha sp. PMI_526]
MCNTYLPLCQLLHSVDGIFDVLAAATGASVHQIRLITCLIISYPLGNIFVRLPPKYKHYFSIFVTFIYFFPILHLYVAFAELLADILATYVIAKNWRSSSKTPWFIFFMIMSHLMVHHVIRVVWNTDADGAIDITGSQMVLTMKLTMFAWNVLDGTRPSEDLDKWQMEKRISTFPSLLEFLGFATLFPKHAHWSLLSTMHNTPTSSKAQLSNGWQLKPKSSRQIPPAANATRIKNGSRLVFPRHLREFSLLQPFGFLERSKYYAVWSLTEGACIITGLGISGMDPVTKQIQWEGAANVDILNLEFAPNFKIILDSWNMKTNVWLRECVYKRVTPKGKKPGFRSSMMTFGTSALWHGISPGYYLSFFTAGFLTTLARITRRTVRPLFLSPRHTTLKRVYDIAGTVFSIFVLNYIVVPFMTLTLSDSLIGWTRVAFYGHFLIWGGLVFFYTGGGKFFRLLETKMKEREIKRNAVAAGLTPKMEGNFMIPPPLDEVIPPPK